jgi:hypothetical protein
MAVGGTLHAAAQELHDVDGRRRRSFLLNLRFGRGGLAAGAGLLADPLEEGVAVLVLVFLRLPGRGQAVHELLGHRQLLGRDAVFLGAALGQVELGEVPQLRVIPQEVQDQRVPPGHEGRHVLPGADDDAGDADLARAFQRLTQQHVALLGLLARGQDVRLVEVDAVHVLLVDEVL